MKSGDRDLLILLSESRYSRVEIEREASLITHMLTLVETSRSITRGVEIIDLNRNLITSSTREVEKALAQTSLRPFQFIFHKS